MAEKLGINGIDKVSEAVIWELCCSVKGIMDEEKYAWYLSTLQSKSSINFRINQRIKLLNNSRYPDKDSQNQAKKWKGVVVKDLNQYFRNEPHIIEKAVGVCEDRFIRLGSCPFLTVSFIQDEADATIKERLKSWGSQALGLFVNTGHSLSVNVTSLSILASYSDILDSGDIEQAKSHAGAMEMWSWIYADLLVGDLCFGKSGNLEYARNQILSMGSIQPLIGAMTLLSLKDK